MPENGYHPLPGQCREARTDIPPRPPSYKIIGIVLAVASGLFIGTSFVLKKTGLLRANKKYNEEAGEGYGYLKNAWWWTGMTLMIIGEICNFAAYAFTDAILVTPLGALSVVITTILSAIFLKERLSFIGKVGCFGCIIGSLVIVLNAPEQSSVAIIQEMQCYVIAPGFLSYTGILVIGCAIIAFWAGPRYGKKSMLVYISVCSLTGGLSVVAIQGLGAAILSQINGRDTGQFKHWFLYVLLVFVVATLLTEIVYLNKALNLFNTALVTPTYYVYFTSATIVTSAILFRGLHGTWQQITTMVLGFLVICSGVILLQLSKSAKDVPDTAVFTGDLDQVRTVAQQEEHESEPKADAIRGAAALIRSFSKAKQHREHEEARRFRNDSLEAVGENELVEWDGLRRRKTILSPGQTAADVQNRLKTFHAPTTPSRLSSTHSSSDNRPGHDDTHAQSAGLFPGLRSKAHTMLNPKSPSGRQPPARGPSAVSGSSSFYSERQFDGATDDLAAMSQTRKSSGRSAYSAIGSEVEGDLGLPSLEEDTAYKSPARAGTVHFADRPTTGNSHAPPAPPPHSSSSKRTFSFQNVFSRSNRDVEADGVDRPISSKSSGGGSFFTRRRGTSNLEQVTEEERLGLVKGDEVVGGPAKPLPDTKKPGRDYDHHNDYEDDDKLDDSLGESTGDELDAIKASKPGAWEDGGRGGGAGGGRFRHMGRGDI